MSTKPETVAQYLDSLEPDRAAALKKVRAVIKKNLDPRIKEGIQYGMIGYFVPHAVYPEGYHCDPKQPLPFAGIASQKHHMGLYLFCIYCDTSLARWFAEAWTAAGKKLDMGKGCVRFKSIDDVPLEVVGEAIRRMPLDAFITQYEKVLPESVKKKRAAQAGAGPAAKKTTKKVTKKTTRKVAKKTATKTAKKAVKKTTKAAAKKTAKKASTAKKTTKR